MSSYIRLVKVFITAIGMSHSQDKKRKVMLAILSCFAVFGVLLPATFGIGLIVNLMTKTLMEAGGATLGIQMMFYVICVFSVLFGINVIFNEFYFSNDIEYLLPLPLRPYQIIASKFTAAFISENFMQVLLVLGSVIGFGMAFGLSPVGYCISIVGIITLPMIPLVYCGLFSMVVMYFTRIIKNKDVIHKITTILMLVLLLGLVSSVGFLKDMDIDHYVAAMVDGNQTFFQVMNWIFPHIRLLVTAMSDNSILHLLAYLLLHVVYIAVFLVAAELLYFDGVIGLNSAKNRGSKKDINTLIMASRQRNPKWAYFKKELQILLRTPAFFMNCIVINFLWPIFLYAIGKLQNVEMSISYFRAIYAKGAEEIRLPFLLLIVILSVIITAMNSIASNAFSREGKHFSFIKYIPLSYTVQWDIKAGISIVISTVGIWIYLLIGFILIDMPVLHILFYMVISILSIWFVSYMGVLIDSIQPKLIWDDEMSALRENYNTFFSMAIAMVFLGIVCGGGYLIFCHTKITLTTFALLLTGVLLLANLVIFQITRKVGIRNIEEQEEA